MTPLLRRWVWLALVPAVWLDLRATVQGQDSPPAGAPAGVVNVTVPFPKSPVDTFRELLAMKSGERELYLTNRPAPVRAQLEQKLQQYEAMKPGDREAILAATELRWYLEQFILSPSTNREAQLALVPQPYREILKQRLDEFERLPPPLQKDVLAHETTRAYFLGRGTVTNRNLIPPPPLPEPLKDLSRLPAPQREKMYASFQNFFELEDADKQKVLDTLPVPERGQVEKTLQVLERLPKEQREQGLQAIDKLAGLTEGQRRLFFSNAGRWKEMSPAERAAWLKLVNHLPPPAELLPPPPSLLPPALRSPPAVATNSPAP